MGIRLRPFSTVMLGTACLLGAILLGTSGMVLVALVDAGPPWAMQFDSIQWTATWLLTLLVQSYGACVLLCCLIVSSEHSRLAAAAWVLGILGGGGVPIAALYLLLWVARHGTLRLSAGAAGPAAGAGMPCPSSRDGIGSLSSCSM